jgi:phytoene dehydrogenase-like protein
VTHRLLSDSEVTVIGAGIAGLVAAITAAGAGARVVVHEAAPRPGGRGRSSDGDWRANYGPHAVYGDGPVPGWLREAGVEIPLIRPPATGFLMRVDGRMRRLPPAVMRAALKLTSDDAPADASFADWASGRTSSGVVHAGVGVASLPTFHPDPGQLSAAFVAERLRRVTRNATKVRYVAGGWSVLVDALVARAQELGAEIRLKSHVTELPDGPVIVATSRTSAGRLLGHELPGHGTRVALLDVGLSALARRAPFAVLDLDERTYVARYSSVDSSLAPAGHHLIQGSAPLRDGEDHAAGTARLEAALDAAFGGWREACAWRHGALASDATGAVDVPGTTWRDRPAIEHGDGVFLAGDYVAAPGMLSEPSWVSGRIAGEAAVAATDRKSLAIEQSA